GDLGRRQRPRAGRPLRRRPPHRRRRRRRPGRQRRAGPRDRPGRVARVPRGRRQGARRLGRPVPRLPRAVTPTPARTTVGDAEVHVLGIRHHGPGSARSTGAALDALQPDHVLLEGPPEADAVAALAADPDLVPPVALLAYSPDDRRRAAYWPLAAFSPEWVALRWALDHDVAVGFRDLPARTVLADPPPRQLRLGDAPDDE